MSDWEESSEEEVKARPKVPVSAPQAPVKKKWVDEDEESDEDVASDWEEEEEKKPPPKPVAQPQVISSKKKMSVNQKIAEKQAARAARIANGEQSSDTEDDIIDPVLKKRLEQEREVEADLKNASDLLGATSISATSSSNDLNELLKANPKTKEEFVALSNQIIEVIIKRHQNKPLYAQFVEHQVRELARPLKDVDVRKCASGLTTLANEKQKELREGGKKKKAGKPALGTVKPGKSDTRVYDESLDDFGNDPDDFM